MDSRRYLRSCSGMVEGTRRSAETRVEGEWMKRFTTDMMGDAVGTLVPVDGG